MKKGTHLDWSNLLENKCPGCGKDIMKGLASSRSMGVIHHKCGFMISEKKYAELISKMTVKKLKQQHASI